MLRSEHLVTRHHLKLWRHRSMLGLSDSSGAISTERHHTRVRQMQVVLDFVTMFLEYLVTELERVAHPVLDAIVQKVWAILVSCDSLHSDSLRQYSLNALALASIAVS